MRTTRVQNLCELAASACASGLDEARRREISLLMDAVAAADLGLPDTAPAAGSVSAGSTIITQTVYASDAFELVVFLFPRGVRLPLHDHRETILTPESPTFALRPDFANIHSFEALADTAVLDLQLPPYDDRKGRDCHYFASEGEAAPALAEAAAGGDSARGGGSEGICCAETLRVISPELDIRAGAYRGPRPRLAR
ncbi:hypothetical protein EMIHUDRAFT_100725 [Emiliania huxleyi CCMP1516]|uniref:Cysteine dioxygenase n=2 Tax=Emiliania huxleyi TaxID=2903 RepID=A0A0D3JQL6_EMIH1|nr:hypothetical protein EMIHUDRAFT_100725 [Emiliania huxleyi CCMP1516]EOD25801.1 hypothetical protein EMIHUDRAFT_100725 [Emiliania huxleyi CCMP1516]|eukprot:XP_005778230.1 hypothetical protein EMIHUDRAFT_100725 [Emiliania huxleyi CCMP1516]